MRAIPSTLLKAQQTTKAKVLAKLVLTSSSTTYTYTKTRILDFAETEDGPLQRLELTLHNRDQALTDLDLKGYGGVLHNGAVTTRGDEYDACAPMTVIAQQFNSDPNKLECTLSLVGRANLMQMDAASETYQPDSDNTDSVKTLIDAIAGATLDCFNHCTAYTTVWEVGYDTLADTYQPKDAFRVYTGNNRLSKINQLLDYTKNVAVFKADGKLHIFKPTTSGSSYQYQYSLEDSDNPHPFFAKALRNTLVIPNYVEVCSRDDDDPSYGGYATDATSYALLPKPQFKQTYLASNAQGTAIAQAILAKAQMWCEAGSTSVPMNVGAEPYDYVKVTDERENDYRIGNIGKLVRHFNLTKNEWRMTFTFGNWQNARKALDQLGITADDLENYFSRLQVGDLYAENILADNIDLVWIDPDGNVDLSQIGDTLDNLPDGEVYARVKSLHLDAGQVRLDENVIYADNYDPTAKFDPSTDSLDDIPEGVLYQRVKSAALTASGLIVLDNVQVGTYGLVRSTDISAGHITLSTCSGDLDDIDNGSTYAKLKTTSISGGNIILNSYTGASGEWYNKSGVEIDANHGINIYGTNQALTTRATKTGTIQCYVGSDGAIYAGAGKVKLNSSGLELDSSSSYGHLHFVNGSSSASISLTLSGILWIDPDSYINLNNDLVVAGDVRPNLSGTRDLGKPTYKWDNLYAVTVHEGDTIFANDWRLTETPDNKGMMLLRPDGSIAQEWR